MASSFHYVVYSAVNMLAMFDAERYVQSGKHRDLYQKALILEFSEPQDLETLFRLLQNDQSFVHVREGEVYTGLSGHDLSAKTTAKVLFGIPRSQRSFSVGDVIYDVNFQETWLCAGQGWKRI